MWEWMPGYPPCCALLPTNGFYGQIWLMFPNTWRWGSGVGVEHKIIIFNTLDKDAGGARAYLKIRTESSRCGRISFDTDAHAARQADLFYNQSGKDPMICADGQWHGISYYVNENKGQIEIWRDGLLYLSYTVTGLFGNASPYNDLRFGAYMNDPAGSSTGGPRTFYVDDICVSTKACGTGNTGTSSAPVGSATPAASATNHSAQTTLFRDGFESGGWSAWGGGEPVGISITAAQAASGTRAAVTTHKAGMGSTAWAATYFGDLMNQAPQRSDVIEEFDTYFDPNATINVSNGGGAKITILMCNEDWKSHYAEPLAYTPFYLTLYADPKFNVWGEIHRKTVTPDVWQELPQNMGSNSPLALGKWQHIKVHARLNTPGKNDGVLEMWINGVQTMAYTAVDFRDSYTMRGWNMYEITGYDNAASSNTWNQYWDNINLYVP